MTATAEPHVSDEDALVVPSAWHRDLHPRRGGAGVRPYTSDPERLADADRLLDAARAAVEESLAHPQSDPELVAAGRAYLAGDATPLGAAAVAAVVRSRLDWREERRIGVFADRWLADHGAGFAARAVVELVPVSRVRESRPVGGPPVAPRLVPLRRLAPTDPRYHAFLESIVAVAGPVRAALAAAPDEVYAATVDALAARRGEDVSQRVLTSFLAPTETGWVTDDCAAVTRENGTGLPKSALDLVILLFASASTTGQVERLAHRIPAWHLMPTPVFLSLVEGAGPAATGTLLRWLDGTDDAEHRQSLLSVLARMPGDGAYQGLLDRVDGRYVPAALLEATGRFPRRAMRLLAAYPGPGLPADLLRGHVPAHPHLAAEVLPVVPVEAADRLRQLIGPDTGPPTAPVGAVPPVLATPPWTVRAPRRKPAVVDGLTCPDGPAVHWSPGERDDWAGRRFDLLRWYPRRDISWERYAESVRAGMFDHEESLWFLLAAPEDLGRSVVPGWRPENLWDGDTWLRLLAARYECDAVPVLLAAARLGPATVAPVLTPFTGPPVAALMADWYSRSKVARQAALAWLTRHPAAAARALVPVAVGRPGTPRRQAEQALRAVAAAGHTAEVVRAAEGYGPQAAAEVGAILSVDPLHLLPARIPTPPAWADPALLPPVRLRDGSGVLPPTAVRHLLTMLAISRLDGPYAGLDQVRRACGSHSLAEFAWALFQRWRDFGSPAKEDWAFHALALLGDDATVRRLAPVIRAWPGEGGHARAVTGLEVLAAIGTDVALLHLHGIARKVTFKGLRDRANQKIAEVAAGLGLSDDQLADRLVPDFGLDPAGMLTLDYGPRRFTVGFDEQLRPVVSDSDGRRLAALPKPGAGDDPELAPAAYQRFAGLKKDVRTIAADQVRRLEGAMVRQRRWTAGDFRLHLVGHPLLRHIVCRLVWTVHDDAGAAVAAFRVAEDRSLADVDDEPYALADDARVSVAHPVLLGGDLAGWVELFADYQVLQPFPQLGRDVHRLTDDERAATRLTRFEGRSASTGRLLGLASRGWRRGAPADGGGQGSVERDGPGGCSVVVDLDPGLEPGNHDPVAPQTLLAVFVRGTGDRHDAAHARVPFGDLDAVTASEVVRDLTEITR